MMAALASASHCETRAYPQRDLLLILLLLRVIADVYRKQLRLSLSLTSLLGDYYVYKLISCPFCKRIHLSKRNRFIEDILIDEMTLRSRWPWRLSDSRLLSIRSFSYRRFRIARIRSKKLICASDALEIRIRQCRRNFRGLESPVIFDWICNNRYISPCVLLCDLFNCLFFCVTGTEFPIRIGNHGARQPACETRGTIQVRSAENFTSRDEASFMKLFKEECCFFLFFFFFFCIM